MTITCLICNSEMKFYFEKPKYHAPSAEKFTQKLMPVQYYQCPECGFFSSKTGNDSNLLIVFYVQIMPDDFVM
ncbi:hypothetical protein, partial [Enterobacter roggenkampii]|uniref:hypothetical protein n=1 Tax=Enterobacter roggenkampii TaxID=1812935 RepID=UPI001F14E2D2